MKKIIQIGDPVLNQKTKDVSDAASSEIQQLIDDLVEICIAEIDTTAGLSAPQIGNLSSVCVCRRMDLEEAVGEGNVPNEKLWEVMINPKITSTSKTTSVVWEACLSIGIGDNQLWGPVERPDGIDISYINRNGVKQTFSTHGFFAHVIQHEIDHLSGILFLNYVQNPENIWKSKQVDDIMKKTGDFPELA